MTNSRTLAVGALAVWLVVAPAYGADKLDKDDRKWLDEVKAIILPEEEKVFKDLQKEDRGEFQKVFWARRNPKGPEAADNEFKLEFEKRRAEAESKFRVPGRQGAETDCGRIYILFGPPAHVRAVQTPERRSTPPPAADTEGAPATYPDSRPFGEDVRSPEVWTYSELPGFRVPGDKIEIGFGGECQLPPGRLKDDLPRLGQARILWPKLDYAIGRDGRLTSLADLLPKKTPGQLLLETPRQDFPLALQPKLTMQGPPGSTYVSGLLRAESAGLAVSEEAGKKRVAVTLALQALDAENKIVASSEQDAVAEVAADGSFVTSYGFALKPGRYTLKVGVVDPKTNRASLISSPADAPDFGPGDVRLSELLVLADIQEARTPDSKDPLSAFVLGANTRLVPRYGNVFSKNESIQLLCMGYHAQADPATGKPSIAARFTISKAGQPVTSSQDIPFEASMFVPNVGPVFLSTYDPGQYLVRLQVTDKVAKKEYMREATFEVKP